MFLELNCKGLYQSSGKEKESCCLLFPSSRNEHFHVVVMQLLQRNAQTRRYESVYLGLDVLGVCEVFLCLLGMHEWCSSVVYFRGWLRCVKWKAWSYIGREFGKVMAVVC